MFNDLGVYGVPGPVKRKERFDAVSAMRKMEKYNYFVFLFFCISGATLSTVQLFLSLDLLVTLVGIRFCMQTSLWTEKNLKRCLIS